MISVRWLWAVAYVFVMVVYAAGKAGIGTAFLMFVMICLGVFFGWVAGKAPADGGKESEG